MKSLVPEIILLALNVRKATTALKHSLEKRATLVHIVPQDQLMIVLILTHLPFVLKCKTLMLVISQIQVSQNRLSVNQELTKQIRKRDHAMHAMSAPTAMKQG